MAEEKPKKSASPALLVAIVAAITFFAIVIVIVLRRDGNDSEDGPPPELGPDTAQVVPQTASSDATVQPAQLADPPAAGQGAAIGDFAFEDETLSFKVTMPDGPATDPMRRWLSADAKGVLSVRKPNARADFERIKRAGSSPQKWDVNITWEYTAKAGDLASLFGVLEEYTGGAHPVQHFDTIIANPETGKRISMADMLVLDRSPSPAMTIAICEALKAAKIERIKSATIMEEPVVCAGASANAKTADAKLALAPSDKPGKFGGVYAYYEPYAVGPYSEGAYGLTVQQEIFAQDLKSEYRKLFDGKAPVLDEDRF